MHFPRFVIFFGYLINSRLFVPLPSLKKKVTGQFYKAEILNEYVMLGNDALVKCNIPSFVGDFVSVDAWVSDRGEEFYAASNDLG